MRLLITTGGDSDGAMSVIGDVNRLRVYDLARFINKLHNDNIIPVTTIDRPPTAELEVG